MVRMPRTSSAGASSTFLKRRFLPIKPPHPSSLLPSTSEENGGGQLQRLRPSPLVKPLWVNALEEGLHRAFADRRCHLTSIDYNTEAKSIIRLELPQRPIQNAFVQKLSKLPTDAVEALGGLIMQAKTSPRQLQNEADILSNQLDVRHFPFPPQAVRQTRAEIINEILEEYPAFVYEYNIWKQRPQIDAELDKLVKKRLAIRRYNWKPLSFKNQQAALVYALSRFPSHFAEMKRVLAEFDRNGFVPEKILDVGSGIGSAFWAAFERWGENVKEYALVDSDLSIRHFSMDLLRGRNLTGSGQMVSRNLFFRKELFPSPKHTYDLVILHRTLIEMPSHEERVKLVEKLWKRTKKYLVIVDSSLNDAFVALMKIRDHLVTGGHDFDVEMTKELLYKNGRLDQDTIELFADRQTQLYQKYCRARELLPDSVKIPTRLEAGHLFAPCPHDQLCPMLERKQPCKFAVKWQEFRADHRTRSGRRDGTEKGTFSFLIMEKGERPHKEETQPRILELNRARKCVSCRVCSPNNGIQRFVVSRRADKVYKRIRRAMPSQLLPVKFSLIKTEAEQFQKIKQIADGKQKVEEEAKIEEPRRKFNQMANLGEE